MSPSEVLLLASEKSPRFSLLSHDMQVMCTYRTSSVLRRPRVGGMLPVKLLLSRSLDTKYRPSTVWASQITRKIRKTCELTIWVSLLTDVWASYVSWKSGSVWFLKADWYRSGCEKRPSNHNSGDSKDPNVKEFNSGDRNVHTSALCLSDYPARDLCHRILEVLQRAYCQPDQTSIASRVFRVMAEWNHWTCLSS